jgi:hypothetical protein
MTVRRDYGTFSKAAGRLLKPMVEPLAYQQIDGVAFGRQRGGWMEAFFLQQNAFGTGDFTVSVGLYVPGLDDLWQEEARSRSVGLIISTSLHNELPSDASAGSYTAADKSELIKSLTRVSCDLRFIESWFSSFTSMSDIAAAYTSRTKGPVAAIQYGFLLILAGQLEEARSALEYAQRKWQMIVREEDPYLQRQRPGKESLSFYALRVHRLKVVEDALRALV